MEDVRAEPTDEPRLLVCGVDVEGESFSESFSRASRHLLESASSISFFPLVFFLPMEPPAIRSYHNAYIVLQGKRGEMRCCQVYVLRCRLPGLSDSWIHGVDFVRTSF